MGAPIQRLRHHITRLPFLSLFGRRDPVPDPRASSSEVVPLFKECEGECGPLAREVEVKEKERAEQFKRDQLLPIMGMVLPR